MRPHARGQLLVGIRRTVQIASVVLFFSLFLRTRAQDGEVPDRLLRLYFDIDPLILLSTWLSSHQLEGLGLLALITVAVTFLLGRVFCGWICPFGVLQQAVTWLRSRGPLHKPRAELFSRWQRGKYYVLFALLVLALLGANWIGIFDPASLLFRSTIATILPALQYAVDETAATVYEADPHVGPVHLTSLTEPVYRFFRDNVFFDRTPVLTGSSLIFLLFVAALGLSLLRPRFWCRYVCPLGALLGLCARRTSLRLAATETACIDCGLCALACPAAAQPERPGEWLPHECFGCFNCVAACKTEAIDFRFAGIRRRPAAGRVNLSRRAALTSLASGIGALFWFRNTPAAAGKRYHPALIRPPGSRPERDFLERCIQCGVCMKACPTNALHPTLAEAGLEGLWSPMLVARLGYCEYECNLCGQVCPTGAIRPLELAEKKKAKIGLATVDTARCLPYAYGQECIVCEEHCPVPDKAIYFVNEEVVLRDGSTRILKQPRVDADRCNGCGICETKCPFTDLAAIRVTSANEDRHPHNQPILPGGGLLGSPPGAEGAESAGTVSPYGD